MKSRVAHAHKPSYQHEHYINVTLHPRWLKYANFLADMGERPAGTSLDRIDNRKGYEPGNCRWADGKTQGENRGCVRKLTFNGRTQNPEDWARELGLRPQTIRSRLDRGWPVERVLTAPGIRGVHGEANRHAKLTAADVRALRKARESGKPIDLAAHAAKHGVTPATIYRASTGQSWRNL